MSFASLPASAVERSRWDGRACSLAMDPVRRMQTKGGHARRRCSKAIRREERQGFGKWVALTRPTVGNRSKAMRGFEEDNRRRG